MSSADSQSQFIHSDQTAGTKTTWSLTQEAFEKLLNSFSSDRDEAAAQYELTRRKLMRFFEWRSVASADERVDETINRVARRIDQGETIENLKSYFYGVARMVFMEALKELERVPVPMDDAPQVLRQTTPEAIDPDDRLVCLDQCLEALPVENRQLIVDYYREERRAKIELRQELADRLNIPLNALRIRAHRIRHTLEQCINRCLEASAGTK